MLSRIEILLEQIRSLNYLAVPKSQYDKDRLVAWFASSALQESTDAWLVPCEHEFVHPATDEQIVGVTSALNILLPNQLVALLKVTNGAEMFRLHHVHEGRTSYYIPRYRILNSTELVRVNQELLETFLSYAEADVNASGTDRLDYVAFCDVLDGNYLALSVDQPDPGTVFFLDHEYGFYPYSMEHEYVKVAPSIETWLSRLIESRGWEGMGKEFVAL